MQEVRLLNADDEEVVVSCIETILHTYQVEEFLSVRYEGQVEQRVKQMDEGKAAGIVSTRSRNASGIRSPR